MAKAYERDICGSYQVTVSIERIRVGYEDETMKVCVARMAKAILKAAKELSQNKGETK